VLWSCNVRATTRKQKGNHQHNLCIHYNSCFIQEASFKYWPNKEESITFGNFFVEFESTDPENKLLIKRTMKVTNTKEVVVCYKNKSLRK